MTQPAVTLQELLGKGLDRDDLRYLEGIKKRRIYLTEEITPYTTEEITIALLDMDKDSNEPIEIIVNTPGGAVYDGFALVNVIERLKSPVTMTVIGYAYSMGAYILMAGSGKDNITRRAYPFSTGLIHSGSQLVEGTGSQVKDLMNFMEHYEQKIKSFVLEKTNINEEEYIKAERYEWYMTAEDMLKYGLIDEIIE